LIAWQYDFRRLLLVSGVIVLLDWSLLTGFWGLRHPYYLSIVGIVLGEGITFLVVGYMFSRMMVAQRRQRQELAEANRHLTRYAAAIEQLATSRERNRLARELHDTLAHSLSALAVQLEAVDAAWEETPAEARTLLVKSLALTRSGLTEARRSLQALRASPLEDLGLALAVRALAESTAARIGATLTLALPEAVENLPPDVEQGFYRIAQEALNNVTKHAAARHLMVVLQQNNGATDLTITDDGQGFAWAAAEMKAGYGLRGMQERAALMGAAFHVTSAPDQGTTVNVSVQNGGPP
jgi:signal transduction histidine kinase